MIPFKTNFQKVSTVPNKFVFFKIQLFIITLYSISKFLLFRSLKKVFFDIVNIYLWNWSKIFFSLVLFFKVDYSVIILFFICAFYVTQYYLEF